MTIDKQKENLRKVLINKRKDLKKNDINSFINLKKNIVKIREFNEAKVIASFISIKTEISTKYLNDFIISLGKTICLPVILSNNDYLIFRIYDKSNKLKIGKFGIPEPDETKKELMPDIILTPCLAFDLDGYRLGYGGGYYDKTFSKLLKISHNFISIAIAYDDQKTDQVYHNEYDKKINYILTEKQLYTPK
mgnify:CR=1 FL=1|tara:strand:+ start:6639 stop:7214 length:576 start_codon:yes stop_codon:yes gene_type:complete